MCGPGRHRAQLALAPRVQHGDGVLHRGDREAVPRVRLSAQLVEPPEQRALRRDALVHRRRHAELVQLALRLECALVLAQ